MTQFTPAARLNRLSTWIQHVESEVADLLLDHRIFWEVQEIIERHPTLCTARSHFFQWMATSFIAAASTSVRRQVDNDAKAVSLRRVLEEIVKYPNLVTRSYYLSVASNGSPESVELNERAFDAWADASGNSLDLGAVQADLDELIGACEKVRHYVDRRVAHYDARGVEPSKLPTFADLDSALDVVERLLQKYYLILRGVWLGEVRPTIAYDWQNIFRTSWL